MSAGDVKGGLRALESLLRAVKYPRDVDYNGLSKGDPSAFLPIVDFTLTTFSSLLTAQLVTAGFEFAGKTDLRFTETVYKVLRDVFQYKPVLSKQQFLQSGFSQSKISVVCDIINLVLQRHKQLKKERRNVRPSPSPSLLVNKVVMPRNTNNSVCNQPYSASTTGASLPFPRHSCSKENHGLLNSTEPQNGQLPNKGKDDLPNVQAVKERKPMEMETFPTALEKLSTLETQLEYLPLAIEKLSTLGTRLETLPIALEKLSMLETRLDVLEKHLEKVKTCGDAHKNQDFVSIPKETWDNLLSRVLLLETKLELASVQREPLEGCRKNGQAITEFLPLTLSSSPPLSYPPQDNLNGRLERISSMMKNTSSLLKSLDVSI